MVAVTEKPGRPDPVAPSLRSVSARDKDATKKNAENAEVRGFREFLEHLGMLTRNRIRVVGGDGVTFDLFATPTPTQRRAFELRDEPVPRTLGLVDFPTDRPRPGESRCSVRVVGLAGFLPGKTVSPYATSRPRRCHRTKPCARKDGDLRFVKSLADPDRDLVSVACAACR